jgi:hydroxyethylthiazole kinase-like uncharacterized protein yjeF
MLALSAAQMKAVDRATIAEHGVAGPTLMENAGAAVMGVLEERFAPLLNGKVVVVCGHGNNGGDGFVVARLLHERSRSVQVLLLSDPAALRGEAAIAYDRLCAALPPEQILSITSEVEWASARGAIPTAELLVDAILGTGVVSAPRGVVGAAIADLNARFGKLTKVAVDMPSGLPSDDQLQAVAPGDLDSVWPGVLRVNATVTFTAPKIGQLVPAAAQAVGDLFIRPIGTPAEVVQAVASQWHLTSWGDIKPLLAPRDPRAHKGDFGHVLVVGGSVGKSGAVAMASEAALRSGAALVTAAVPRSVLPMVAAYRPEIMTEAMAETAGGTLASSGITDARLRAVLERKTVIGAGPGLGRDPDTCALLDRLLAAAAATVVLDADGLNSFAGRLDRLHLTAQADGTRPPLVLTPHPGEMARLLDVKVPDVEGNRILSARRVATETGGMVVLKGHRTVVAEPDGTIWINSTGNPGMATGGAGDVLTGMIAGYLAQHAGSNKPPLSAAAVTAASVYLHGLAGDFAAAELGEAQMLATDITGRLRQAIRYVQSQNEQQGFFVPRGSRQTPTLEDR